jgi:arogenate dehydrogenase (NADP+)
MKIGIVGLGLIGGSLAYDLKQQNHYVIGVSRQQITCQKALERGIVDQADLNLAILQEAELIFICTPIALIIPLLKSLSAQLNPQTIITDVGSVKSSIVYSATKLWANFIGSHPMAGTAEQGIDAIQPNLFNHAPCVITPVTKTVPSAIITVTQIWESLGCQVIRTQPEIHDQAVAWISHLPVMISANLINSCSQFNDLSVVELAQKIASSGFRDTSRVGGGNVELGLMMAQYNKEYLLSCLHNYQDNLTNLIQVIEAENWHSLTDLLTQAQSSRPNFSQEISIN